MAERIQLRRTKGWRKPSGAIVVARPSKWGNPWKLVTPDMLTGPGDEVVWCPKGNPRFYAVDFFRADLMAGRLAFTPADARQHLRGHDLACWCKPDDWCHADVLLELANPS